MRKALGKVGEHIRRLTGIEQLKRWIRCRAHQLPGDHFIVITLLQCGLKRSNDVKLFNNQHQILKVSFTNGKRHYELYGIFNGILVKNTELHLTVLVYRHDVEKSDGSLSSSFVLRWKIGSSNDQLSLLGYSETTNPFETGEELAKYLRCLFSYNESVYCIQKARLSSAGRVGLGQPLVKSSLPTDRDQM